MKLYVIALGLAILVLCSCGENERKDAAAVSRGAQVNPLHGRPLEENP